MATRDDVKRAVCQTIDREAERIIGLGESIRKNPELGFKEFKTARLVEETLKGLGLSPRPGLAVTGVRAEARGAKDGPTFALLGELDGLVVAGHPVADPQTGAAHACGHNAQIAGLLGAAMGLVGAKAFDHLASAGKDDDLEAQFAALGSHSVDDELAQLKLERSGKRPEPPHIPKELPAGSTVVAGTKAGDKAGA